MNPAELTPRELNKAACEAAPPPVTGAELDRRACKAAVKIAVGRVCKRLCQLPLDGVYAAALAEIIAGECWWGPGYHEAERRREDLQARLDEVELRVAEGES